MQEIYLGRWQLRNRNHGYAVSIVKAGMEVVGRSAGSVRPPLTDLTGEEKQQLAKLVSAVSRQSIPA